MIQARRSTRGEHASDRGGLRLPLRPRSPRREHPDSARRLAGPPEPGAAAEEYARWLAADPPGARFWTGAHVELLGLLAMLAFFVAFSAVLRPLEGEWDWLPVLALGAGLVSVAVKLASGPIAVAAYDRAPTASTATRSPHSSSPTAGPSS